MKHRHKGRVKYRTKKGKIRYRKRPLHVQTLIFPKKRFTRKKALKWAEEHRYKHYTSRLTDGEIRVRQFNPKFIKRVGGRFPIGEDIEGLYVEKV